MQSNRRTVLQISSANNIVVTTLHEHQNQLSVGNRKEHALQIQV